MPSTDNYVVENLNGVRRALRDELIRLGTALDETAEDEAGITVPRLIGFAADAYVALGGDLEQGPTDAQRELEQERDRAVIEGRAMADAIDAVVTEAQALGGSYFEGEVFADFRAAIERLRDSSPRFPPIRVHG